jgi:hypothetical protein
MDLAVKKVQEGETFVYVLDNIDWMEKVHDIRSDAQNVSVHAVATNLVFDRVSSKDLTDDGPQKDLKDCNMKELVSLTEEETNQTKERYKLLFAKILCQYFPAFKFLEDLVPAHLPHEHTEAINTKSVVVPFPVLMKDEKYSDVVDVIDQLETWSHDIYSKAGICSVSDFSHQRPPLSSKLPPPDQINQLHIFDLWRPPLIRYKMLKFPAMVISFHEYGLLVQKTCDLDVIQLETDLTTFIHSI